MSAFAYFVIRSNSGKFAALDELSGGYPYFVDYPHMAKFWTRAEEAQKYVDMFKGSAGDETIEVVQATIAFMIIVYCLGRGKLGSNTGSVVMTGL